MKKLIGYLIGIPAAIIVCSESTNGHWFGVQIMALVALLGVLTLNGVIGKAVCK